MTSVAERIRGFLNSPQGRKLTQVGRRQAAKPKHQQKLRQIAERMTGRSFPRR
jgi:hypothetical protein